MVHLIRTLVSVLSIVTVASSHKGLTAAQAWSFSDAAVAVGPKGKDAASSYPFDGTSRVDDIIELSSTESLRLTFTTKDGQSIARPHQSFILVEDPSAKLDISIPVSVKASGKGKIDLDHRDLPPQLLYADTLKLSLLIASFGDSTPLKHHFASIKPIASESSPPEPSPPERWGPKPEITHTFRQPQKLPKKSLSVIFALAVTAGLPIFAILLIFVSANVSSFSSALSSAPIAHVGFFASLILFEYRFYSFWINGTLGQILVEIVGIGIFAFLTGRQALGEVMQRRSVVKA